VPLIPKGSVPEPNITLAAKGWIRKTKADKQVKEDNRMELANPGSLENGCKKCIQPSHSLDFSDQAHEVEC